MASKIIKRTLRLKQELNEKITAEAERIGISVNAYITMILAKEVGR